MDDPKRIDEVVVLDRHHLAELLRVAQVEVRLQPVDVEARLAELQALIGKVDDRDVRAGAREVDRIRADAAADLQHLLAAPAYEVRELRDVRLDEIFARLDLVEVFLAAHGAGRVADVAGAAVPVRADLVDDRGAVRGDCHAGQAGVRAVSFHIAASAPERRWMSSPNPSPT